MEAIKETLQKVIGQLSAQQQSLSGNDPWLLLKKALTKREGAHIKFNYFKKGVLCVYIDSSGWLYSLDLKKEALLRQVQHKNKSVKALRFCIGEIK